MLSHVIATVVGFCNRHVWPILLVVIFGLWFFLPSHPRATSLTYTQFVKDVQSQQVKTAQLATTPGGTTTGQLKNGTNYTVVNTTATGASNYMDSGLDPTKTYSYKIKALGDNVTNSDSVFSNVVMASAAGLNPPTAIDHSSGFAGASDSVPSGAMTSWVNCAVVSRHASET